MRRHRVVVILLVSIGRRDLKIDHAQRGRPAHDGAVCRDRFVPLLLIEQGVGCRQFGLQVFRANAGHRARQAGPVRFSVKVTGGFGRRNGWADRRPAPAEARRLGDEPPGAGAQADHREATLLVGRRCKTAADVLVVRGDRGPLIGSPFSSLNDAADAAWLSRSGARETKSDDHGESTRDRNERSRIYVGPLQPARAGIRGQYSVTSRPYRSQVGW